MLAAKDAAASARTAADAPGPTATPTQPPAALARELADLLYHALVLVAERGMTPAAVIDVLRSRHP